jgi:hypothetical protein
MQAFFAPCWSATNRRTVGDQQGNNYSEDYPE